MIVLAQRLEDGFSLQLRIVEGDRPGPGARGRFSTQWYLVKENPDQIPPHEVEVSDATAQTIVLTKRTVVSVVPQ